MAVTIYDLLHPTGELERSMFPDHDLDEISAAWFTDAATRTAAMDAGDTQDAAVKAWVYYRAFTTLANWIAAKPSLHSYTGDDRREAWGNDRVKHWQTKAEAYLAQFNTLAEPVITNAFIGYSVSATRLAVW